MIQLNTTKLAFFASNKDKIPLLSKSHVIYHYKCPGCSKSYVGKTDTTLFRRTEQHGWEQQESAILKHFSGCQGYQDIKIQNLSSDNDEARKAFQISTIRNNITVLCSNNNRLTLDFLESLLIKELNPELNEGIKAAKKLHLF